MGDFRTVQIFRGYVGTIHKTEKYDIILYSCSCTAQSISVHVGACGRDMEVKIKTIKKGKLAFPQTLNYCTSENFPLYSINRECAHR